MPTPDRATLIDIYRRTQLALQADAWFRAAVMGGQLQIIYYSPRGQEVLAAATMAALRPDDYLVTTYRGLHDALAKGVPPRALFAEYAGRLGGTCKGKGGPMHITHPETGVMVTTGVVGSGLPIANGLALASQLSGDGRVSVVTFGDAATNIGAFHEALNMAQLWKLPVVFVCQNNRYGEHTPYAMSTDCARLVDRGPAYGIRAVEVDGNNALAMYAAAADAVARARAGEGPTFIDARTFRFHGHLLGDDGHYIPADEMAAAKAADPVPALRRVLLSQQVGEGELDAIDAETARTIADAAAFAVASPMPDVREIRHDVFAHEVAA